MKRNLIGAAAIALMGIASCSKSDNNSVSLPANGWNINGNIYKVKTATCYSGRFTATDSFNHRLTIEFYETPSTNATYNVAGIDTVNFIPQPNEAVITYQASSSNYYYSSYHTNAKVTVTMTNGRVNVSIPNIWVKSYYNDDSLMLAARMVQTQ